jgi:Secretion system C-terminal sorting domain
MTTLHFFLKATAKSNSPKLIKKIFLMLVLHCITLSSFAQIIFGANNYTEYHIGNLPIVISVPHGGNLAPTSLPNRICNNAVTVSDANTIELAQQIDSAFVNTTGCNPHMIYCHLKRTKLDCNRNISDGACGNAIAENAWHEFNDFIDTAQKRAQNQFGGNAFYIDLHGHGNAIQRIELGYLLYDNELAYTDNVLNTNQYVGYSSIQNLVANNANNYTHAQLLRGNFALGTLLGNAGYPSVPSMQIPFPGINNNYFSGGYNTANHTSYVPSITVNGMQIECNFTNVRDTYSNRKLFADSLVAVIINYLNIHQNLSFANCGALLLPKINAINEIKIFPNPSKDFIEIQFTNKSFPFEISIFNGIGECVVKTNNSHKVHIGGLAKGLYMVSVRYENKKLLFTKIIVE